MNDNKFLLVKGLAGLGNRTLSTLTAILYARLSGRRLVIDWSDPTFSNNETNVFYRLFQCSLSNAEDKIPSTDSVNPFIWRGHLHQHATNMRNPYKNNHEFWQRTSIDLTKLNYHEDVLVMWTYHEQVDLLRNHFKDAYKEYSQMSKEVILSKLLDEDLILHPQIQNRVNEFKLKNLGKKTVGVHVRYTDHRTSFIAILDKLDTVLRVESGLQIFLATDNIQIKKLFEENYPDVITTPHWYPKPGSRLHDNKDCPDRLEGGIEALVDLYLLAACDYLIIDTSSSFSYLAKLLSKLPDSKIFDVRQKGKRSPLMRRYTWKLMQRLGLFSWGLNAVSKFVRIQKLLSS